MTAAQKFEEEVQVEEPPSMAIEPPTWAVKASGEARLEPVGLTASTHDPIDLSSNPCFQVGRSPSSDMQLMHPTASRKHALIFHHPNTFCYIVDCGSSHGTYVNGVRVSSPTLQQGSDHATAIPHRVRKGSLIRFGGPGAPTFVLKSFSTSLETFVDELNSGKPRKNSNSGIISAGEHSHSPMSSGMPAEGKEPSVSPTLSPTKENHPKLDDECSPVTALVALNTRVNALGGGASLTERNLFIAQKAASKFATALEERDQIDSCLLGKRSRFNSDVGFDTPSFDRVKRVRSASFPASFPLIFSPKPACGIIKNEEDDSFNDRSHDLTETPLCFHRALTSSSLELDLLGGIEARQPKVKFQDEVEHFYPASVTPDEHPGSFEDHVTPNLESMMLL